MLSDTKFLFNQGAFDIDPVATVGLALRVRGGVRFDPDFGLSSTPNATLALTASTVNYVEIDDNGVISSNTTGFTSGATFLYTVTTGASRITGIADLRQQPLVDPALTPASTLPNASTIGGIPRVIQIDIADASADTDVIVRDKLRVLGFSFESTGIAAHATLDTVQLKNGSTAITEAVAKTATVAAHVRNATLVEAAAVINAGGTMRVTAAKNTNVAGKMFVTVVPVA